MPRKRRETEQNETDLLYYKLRIIVSTSSNYLCFFSTDLSVANMDNEEGVQISQTSWEVVLG
jgi:arginine/lysine/ornithine decarboxylase